MIEIKILDNLNDKYINEVNDLLISWIKVDNLENIKNGIKNKTYPITIILLKDNVL